MRSRRRPCRSDDDERHQPRSRCAGARPRRELEPVQRERGGDAGEAEVITTISRHDPEPCPALVRAASATRSWVRACVSSAHPVRTAAPASPSASDQRSAQPQRHEREPAADADHRGEHRAARVRQHHDRHAAARTRAPRARAARGRGRSARRPTGTPAGRARRSGRSRSSSRAARRSRPSVSCGSSVAGNTLTSSA